MVPFLNYYLLCPTLKMKAPLLQFKLMLSALHFLHINATVFGLGLRINHKHKPCKLKSARTFSWKRTVPIIIKIFFLQEEIHILQLITKSCTVFLRQDIAWRNQTRVRMKCKLSMFLSQLFSFGVSLMGLSSVKKEKKKQVDPQLPRDHCKQRVSILKLFLTLVITILTFKQDWRQDADPLFYPVQYDDTLPAASSLDIFRPVACTLEEVRKIFLCS